MQIERRFVLGAFTLLFVLGCAADRAASPRAPEPRISANLIYTFGTCKWGGDDFHGDARWSDTMPCDTLSAFTGSPFTMTVYDSTPSIFYDTLDMDHRPVYWVDAVQIEYAMEPVATGYYRGDASRMPATVSATGNLDSGIVALAYIGFYGTCPNSLSLNDDACATWAFDNMAWHDEPVFCVGNPAFTLFDICEWVGSAGGARISTNRLN